MHSSDSRYTDLADSLKDIDTFDVVMFTHPHDDHVKGAADFFYFDHAVKYQTGERAKIKELWISAAFLLDVNPCEDARVIRQEARYRLKECGGKGVKIFAAPGSLTSWLEKHELSTDENDHPIIHTSFGLGSITKAEYLTAKAAAVQQRDSTAARLAELEAKLENVGTDGELQNQFVVRFRPYVEAEIKEITQEILSDLLNEIRVYPGGRLEIIWNYREEYEKMMLDLN